MPSYVQVDLTDMAKYFKLDAGMLDLSVRGEQVEWMFVPGHNLQLCLKAVIPRAQPASCVHCCPLLPTPSSHSQPPASYPSPLVFSRPLQPGPLPE